MYIYPDPECVACLPPSPTFAGNLLIFNPTYPAVLIGTAFHIASDYHDAQRHHTRRRKEEVEESKKAAAEPESVCTVAAAIRAFTRSAGTCADLASYDGCEFPRWSSLRPQLRSRSVFIVVAFVRPECELRMSEVVPKFAEGGIDRWVGAEGGSVGGGDASVRKNGGGVSDHTSSQRRWPAGLRWRPA